MIDNESGRRQTIAKRPAQRSITCVDALAAPGASLVSGDIRPRSFVFRPVDSFLSRELEPVAEADSVAPVGSLRSEHRMTLQLSSFRSTTKRSYAEYQAEHF